MTAPSVDPDAGIRAEIAHLQRQVDRLEREVKTQREQILGLITTRSFAESDAANYVDRSFLER